MIVQTLDPDAAAIRHAAAHDAAGFAAGELERRRELGYPPYASLIRVELAGADRARLDDARGRGPVAASTRRSSRPRRRSARRPGFASGAASAAR